MSATIYTGIPMRGDLCVVVRDAFTQRQLRRVEIRNKITFLAADLLVELLAQRATDPADARYNSIFSMRMGSSSAPATRTDTNLGVFVIGKELQDIHKTTGVPGELTFTATLEAGDANGSTMQEAGLFTRGNSATPSPSDAPGTTPGVVRMFARQAHPPIPKTAAITIEYTWRIAFTA